MAHHQGHGSDEEPMGFFRFWREAIPLSRQIWREVRQQGISADELWLM